MPHEALEPPPAWLVERVAQALGAANVNAYGLENPKELATAAIIAMRPTVAEVTQSLTAREAVARAICASRYYDWQDGFADGWLSMADAALSAITAHEAQARAALAKGTDHDA